MFANLVLSSGHHARSWTTPAVMASSTTHAMLLAALAYATVQAPAAARRVEEMITYTEITEAKQEAPKPAEAPPPPPPVVQQTQATPPPVAKGFQELIPPEAPPLGIKAEDPAAREVKAEDYSGLGVAGGRATGVVGGVPATEEPAAVADTAPVFMVEETGVSPQITNLGEVTRLLERNYPRQYADAGIAGQVTVKFMIDSDGTVPQQSISVIDATNSAFGEAALKAVSKFRFKPIKYRGERVRVWATMPIAFKPPE